MIFYISISEVNLIVITLIVCFKYCPVIVVWTIFLLFCNHYWFITDAVSTSRTREWYVFLLLISWRRPAVNYHESVQTSSYLPHYRPAQCDGDRFRAGHFGVLKCVVTKRKVLIDRSEKDVRVVWVATRINMTVSPALQMIINDLANTKILAFPAAVMTEIPKRLHGNTLQWHLTVKTCRN